MFILISTFNVIYDMNKKEAKGFYIFDRNVKVLIFSCSANAKGDLILFDWSFDIGQTEVELIDRSSDGGWQGILLNMDLEGKRGIKTRSSSAMESRSGDLFLISDMGFSVREFH